MEQEPASLVKVTSPKSRKNKKVNIEIRDGTWYLLPGTILPPTKAKFHEHKRRDNIAKNYGKVLEDGSIEIVKECSVPAPLSAWHLVQGNSDGTPNFSCEILRAIVKEPEQKPKYDIEKKDTKFEENEEDDSVDELSKILQKQLSISRCSSHLMRPHPTVMILCCEYGCGHRETL